MTSRYRGVPLADLNRAQFEQLEQAHEDRLLAAELEEHYDGGDDE
jgi:hypothetical protein